MYSILLLIPQFELSFEVAFCQELAYCTFAFERATFSWLLLFITKYRASSKKSSTLNFFLDFDDEAFATLLLTWSRLSAESELSLSSLTATGDVAFLFLLFTLVLSSCGFSSLSLAFSKTDNDVNHQQVEN